MKPGRYLRIPNWSEFQVYKDRNPPWIRLYHSLLGKPKFMRLPDDKRWLVVGLWLLASRAANAKELPLIPLDPEWVAFELRMTEEPDLVALVEHFTDEKGENGMVHSSAPGGPLGYDWYGGSDWQTLSAKLYACAAEVAEALEK